MTSKEALKLAILEYEKDLEFDENNQWVKNVLNGLKECQQGLDRLEQLEILKKYYPPFKEFLEEMFEKEHNKDLTKVKEWLEND